MNGIYDGRMPMSTPMTSTSGARAATRRGAVAWAAVALTVAITGCAAGGQGDARSAASADAESVVAVQQTSAARLASKIVSGRSTTSPSSIWVVVNKKNPLSPRSYAPKDLTRVRISGTTGTLRKSAASALTKLAAASKKATGASMTITSAYRSYTTQVSVYAKWKSMYGTKKADLLSARPGYSEHQTGLAVDVGQRGSSCALDTCFGSTATGKWVAKNAWKYGFIVRYPKGKTSQTGYSYEPWHLRYVGLELAATMHDSGTTVLEKALGYPNATSY